MGTGESSHPAIQVTGLKLEILRNHALLQLMTHPFLIDFYGPVCKGWAKVTWVGLFSAFGHMKFFVPLRWDISFRVVSNFRSVF